MKVGDLVRVKMKYSEWGYGVGILLEKDKANKCKILLDNSVVVFYKHELEVVNEMDS